MIAIYLKLLPIINDENVDSMEYHIARTFIENIYMLGEVSIGELADVCNVSKSMLSKFVIKIGLVDYSVFKYACSLVEKIEEYLKDKRTMNITDCLIQNGEACYMDILLEDIQHLFSDTDVKILEQIVEDIHSYKNVAAFGEVYSETACLNFQYKMTLYRKFIYTSINVKRQEEYICEADEDTLILIFSNSGNYIKTNRWQEGSPERECFHKTRGKVILITSNEVMKNDPRVNQILLYRHVSKVQNHPILYQLLIERLAACYQRKYGFPSMKL